MLRTWPLTTVKRWVASANSFTLDFGSYSDYYSVQTREGDKISELIAGYIDIILKKRRRKENLEASINVMSAQEGNTESEAAVAQLMTVQSGQAIPVRLFYFIYFCFCFLYSKSCRVSSIPTGMCLNRYWPFENFLSHKSNTCFIIT